MSKDTLRQFANLFSVILALTMNVFTSILPLLFWQVSEFWQ
jgi:hypothetical protein